MSDTLPLKIGSFGERVAQWQNFLIKNGFGEIIADGRFGPATQSATKTIQSLNGLLSDGVVGNMTWSLLSLHNNGNNKQKSIKWPEQNYDSMVSFYGQVGENQTQLVLPYKLKLAWDKNIEIEKITCHKLVADSLFNIFESTLKNYGEQKIGDLRLNLFGGCLNVRKMRGGSSWSVHSWGAAVDIDPDNNQLKWGAARATLAGRDYYKFWDIVEQNGWVSLGRERGYDWMHFQAARL
jgi:hypothetical protein